MTEEHSSFDDVAKLAAELQETVREDPQNREKIARTRRVRGETPGMSSSAASASIRASHGAARPRCVSGPRRRASSTLAELAATVVEAWLKARVVEDRDSLVALTPEWRTALGPLFDD